MLLKGHINNDRELTVGFSNVAAIGDFDSFHGLMGAKGIMLTRPVNPLTRNAVEEKSHTYAKKQEDRSRFTERLSMNRTAPRPRRHHSEERLPLRFL